jgi:phenylpropionate dioxygenase-like ring-hydroxylating dioxygenase large terminal subunit
MSNDNVTTLPNWEMFDRTDVQKFQIGPVRWNVGASRITENFNDIVHFSTIHATTFGSVEQPVSAQKITETSNGFASTLEVRQQYRNTLDGLVDEVLAN